jgi:CHAT domain
MQTMVIRIEVATQGSGYPVYGIQLGPNDEQISNEPLGTLPYPLPPVPAGAEHIEASRVLSDAMIAHADADVRPADIGRYLWDLLASTSAIEWWRTIAKVGNGAPPDTMLDVRAPDLRPLPWELMTRSPDGHRPFGNPKSSWSRGDGQTCQTPELLVPVRMLVVVGDPADERLRVDDEVDAIMCALRSMTGRWHVEVLVKPTLSEFNGRLEELEPDVLHVITHGRVRDDGTVLTFPVDDDKAWDLTAGDVANLSGPPPRLVVLNACRSKEGQSFGHEVLRTTWTFTDAFLGLGSLAVIAMQGNIPSDAAIPFSNALYRSLADGEPLHVASAKGRKAIYEATKTSSDERSWAMPSLHLRGRSDRLLKVAMPVAGNPLRDHPYSTFFGKVPGYVDRALERRRLLTNLDPAGAGPESPVYLVEGPRDVGKSAVTQAALLSYHLRGRRVVYVDVGDAKRTSRKYLGDSWGESDPDQVRGGWVDVLRRLRDELGQCIPGAEPHVKRFNDRFARYKTIGVSSPLPSYDPGQVLPDDFEEYFDDEREDYQRVIAAVFDEFCGMLVGIADGEPLLLALDHLHKMLPYDLRYYVVPFLLDRLGRDEMTNVHAVLIDRPDQLKQLLTHSRLTHPEALEIKKFRRMEIRRLGGDYCAYLELLPIGPEVRDVLTALTGHLEEFDGKMLNRILGIINKTSTEG